MKRFLIALFVVAVISMALGARLNAQQTRLIERLSRTQPEDGNQTVNYETLIDRYFESLNETGGQRRRELIKQTWTENGTFAYPGQEVKGLAAIDADVESVQKKYPGAKVRRTSKVEVIKNNYVRFNWDFAVPGGETLIRGVDFAVIAGGKLVLVVGFFDYVRDAAKKQETGN